MTALLEAVDPGHRVVAGWNQVLNRSLPWVGAQTVDEPCFAARARFTATVGDQVVGVAQRTAGFERDQLLVAVDPRHRGCGIGGRLAALVDDSSSSPVEVFFHDPCDPASAALAARHRLGDEGGEPLVLWSLDARTARLPCTAGYDVTAWREEGAADVAALRDAVRWWATDNPLSESEVAAWQAGLTGDLVTTVVRDVDRHIVGVTWAEPVPFTDLWRSTHVAVSPEHRGNGLGVALKLAQAEQARASGASGLVTQIAGRNRANAVWAAAGGSRRDLTPLGR